MGEVRVTSKSAENGLRSATMKVSQAHMVLTGIVESAVHPDVQASARRCLATLEEAVTDLREVALWLSTTHPQ